MHFGFGLFLFIIYIFVSIQTNYSNHHHYSHLFRKSRDIPAYNDSFLHSPLISSTEIQPIRFFQNEPIPLASSVVDDLTTLASTVYIISLIIIIFVILAWITHYNAPCSSLITSLLSAITGLPEPIIHSVAFCGSCCIWCENTWLFRRIHQFNIWMSVNIKKFISGTCKVLYDSICPCCRPPDTPSNRSIIGSLPSSIIAMISAPDVPNPSPPKPIVTVLEPTSVSPGFHTVQVNSNTQSTPICLIENQDSTTSLEAELGTFQIDENKITRKKRYKRSRKRVQVQQQSAIDQSSYASEESHHDFSVH